MFRFQVFGIQMVTVFTFGVFFRSSFNAEDSASIMKSLVKTEPEDDQVTNGLKSWNVYNEKSFLLVLNGLAYWS